MKTIFVILFAAATLCAVAQDTTVVRLEYFIDADPGTGNATSINVPPGKDITLPFIVNVTGYSTGYHKLYIRTRDNFGKWSLTARRNIKVLPSQAKSNVVGGEYFIDEDPGYGAAFTINVAAPDTAVLQNFTVATAALTEGYHKLYGRFKDTYGNWSQTFRRNIEIIKSENNKVINGEYFFRTDNGFGSCTPVTFTMPSADGTFSFTIPANQVPANDDTLFLRVRDDIESRWSLTQWVAGTGTLPLTLLDFTATRQLNAAMLQWQTTNEVNTAYFIIERSTDALHFTGVASVSAANNGAAVNNYNYADHIAGISSKTIYYRLQQVDIDARSAYSKIVAINSGGIKSGFSIMPNPAKDFVNILAAKPEDLNGAIINILDMTGHLVMRRSLSASNNPQVNVSGLPRGTYIIHIVTPTVVETKKLLLQ